MPLDAMMSYAVPGADEKVFAEFYSRATIDQAKSKEAGYPVFVDVVHIKILQPGDARLSEYNQPARPQDIERFPRQWAAFQRQEKQDMEGAPLSLLFPTNPAIVENLKRFGVFVVEQLATLNDTALQEIGLGARTFKQKAQEYLAQADKGKSYHNLADRLEKLELAGMEKDDKIKALEAALAVATEEAKANKRKEKA